MSAPLKLSRLLRKTTKITIFRNKSGLSAAQSQPDQRTWQLHSSVVLTRYPIITPDLTPFEKEIEKHVNALEIKKSFLSDFEVEEKIFEKKMEEKQKGGEIDNVSENETELFKTVDLKAKWETEMKEFTPASRTNDPEVESDMTSLRRKMDRQLVLIVRQVFSERKTYWSLPQFRRQEGQSMREAAEQALQLCSGGGIDATFMGNAPCGFGKYKLPHKEEEFGVKVFFFKATYNHGKVLNTEEIEDYKWVTHEELQEHIQPEYAKYVKRFLIEF